jgi:RNA polymerase subunit RPABC4/transcription elongation factor Spt4
MTEPAATRACPWCSATAAADATNCPSCGAALAQRDDLGGVVIAGVTGVDPGLKAYADQPMRIKGPSPTQGLATGIVPAVALGGPAGLAIIGGIAAVAATEYLSAKGPGAKNVDPKTVGELGGLAQLALEKATRDEATAEVDHTWDVPTPDPAQPRAEPAI